jgi:hypothetical protein
MLSVSGKFYSYVQQKMFFFFFNSFWNMTWLTYHWILFQKGFCFVIFFAKIFHSWLELHVFHGISICLLLKTQQFSLHRNSWILDAYYIMCSTYFILFWKSVKINHFKYHMRCRILKGLQIEGPPLRISCTGYMIFCNLSCRNSQKPRNNDFCIQFKFVLKWGILK